jgi:cell division protein FtsB
VSKKRNGAKAPIAQFVAIIVLSISIFLIVDFGRRAAANYRVQREADRLSQEVAAARQRQAELLARRTYVASDLYVEAVARNELKWGQPGETVIVVMPTPEAIALPTDRIVQTVTVLPMAQNPAEAWWLLFFGENSLPVDPADPP